MINFYDILPKELKNKELLEKHTNMKIPFRLLIVGASGSGKTNVILNLVKLHSGIYDKIILCVKNIDEPLYQYLISKIPKDQIEVITNIEELRPPEQYQTLGGHSFVIFDDMCLCKNQDQMAEFYIRCRKLNISVAYLTQSYVKADITIRRNCNYIILKKIPNNRDIIHILNDYSLGGVDKKLLLKMYRDATNNYLDFLFIDIDANDKQKFRKGFKNIILY